MESCLLKYFGYIIKFMAPVLRKEEGGGFSLTEPTGKFTEDGQPLFNQLSGSDAPDAVIGRGVLGRTLERAAEATGEPLRKVVDKWKKLKSGETIEW